MVNFRNLRASRPKTPAIDPQEIFRRLPKPAGINDLYTSQAQVLEEWFKRRTERDLVVKLHTGGGKTLVGLLIGQSTLNELRQPVIYLCPNRQLTVQALEKAAEYNIPVVPYKRGGPLPDEFLSADAILVCTYAALFNGLTLFGLRGSPDVVIPGGIILDDAHVASDTVRDAFTLRVNRREDDEAYHHLAGLFRHDFDGIGRLGTFDDLIGGRDWGVVEVPYWAWHLKLDQIREYLRARAASHRFEWPLVRDALDYCHALISNQDFVVTPIFPLVDLFPTFVNAGRRIYMSATIPDDSEIIRTFDADQESLSKPITTQGLAGVSERLIIAPELTRVPKDQIRVALNQLAAEVAEKYGGVVILVPSRKAAEAWTDIATFADGPDAVAAAVKTLQSGIGRGPYVFANRYDGIDLPRESCRLLIVDGMPRGSNEYDRFRAAAILGGNEFNAALGQRFEQGIGRGARGSGDYCVVAITGRELISWIGRESNLRFLTSSTNAQLAIGSEVSRDIEDSAACRDTALQCLDRDRDWLEYHAEQLDELTQGVRDASV